MDVILPSGPMNPLWESIGSVVAKTELAQGAFTPNQYGSGMATQTIAKTIPDVVSVNLPQIMSPPKVTTYSQGIYSPTVFPSTTKETSETYLFGTPKTTSKEYPIVFPGAGSAYPGTAKRTREEYELQFLSYPESGLAQPPILTQEILTPKTTTKTIVSPSFWFAGFPSLLTERAISEAVLIRQPTAKPLQQTFLSQLETQIPLSSFAMPTKETQIPQLKIPVPIHMPPFNVPDLITKITPIPSLRIDAMPLEDLMQAQIPISLQGFAFPYPTPEKTTWAPPITPQTGFSPPRMSYPYSPFDLPSGFGLFKGRKQRGYQVGLWEFPVKGPKATMKALGLELLSEAPPRKKHRRK
jgi:hypothetical protein